MVHSFRSSSVDGWAPLAAGVRGRTFLHEPADRPGRRVFQREARVSQATGGSAAAIAFDTGWTGRPRDGMMATPDHRPGGTVLFNKGYEGDLTSAQAWRFLEENPEALLIDVRTVAEWVYVGLPDISRLGRTVVCVQWNVWPQMEINREFLAHLRAEGVTREQPLLLICRSGHRSRDAAVALTAEGFGPCYNVSDGFEGDLDDAKHRGAKNGWKVCGLPWVQQ